MRVWSYVITTDHGTAPNYNEPAVTLAICKPRIRRRAEVNDLIIGFNGKTLSTSSDSVRWAGVVSEVISMERYWDDERFSNKKPDRSLNPDNIYKFENGMFFQVKNNSHDNSSIKTDIGGKNVLVFKDVWHMGGIQSKLPVIFSRLHLFANRRLELLNDITSEEWNELHNWLDANNDGLPNNEGSAACKPCSQKEKISKKC